MSDPHRAETRHTPPTASQARRPRGAQEASTMTTTPIACSGSPAHGGSQPHLRSTPGGADPQVLPCRRFDPELWFAERPEDVERAKALCVGCPLQAACLDTALRRGEPWGVWGGELLVDGHVVARKRPRGRPRKHPVAA